MQFTGLGCRGLGLARASHWIDMWLCQPKLGLLWSSMSHSWPVRDRTRWCLKTIFTSVSPVFTIGNDLTSWVTPNGQSKELPTWKSRKHPFNPRKSVGTAGGGACQDSKCYLIFSWERGKQPAQDLCKLTANQGRLASLSFCSVPLSLEATQIWASSFLISSVYASASTGNTDVENTGMAFVTCLRKVLC